MTPRQKKFADNYIKTGNYYQSAIQAGYSEKYASRANYLLDIVGVKEYIDSKMKKLEKPTIATAEEVLEYLTGVLRGDIKEKAVKVIDGEMVTITYEPDIKEKTKCADLLGKRYGIYLDKKEVTVNIDKGLEDFFSDDE